MPAVFDLIAARTARLFFIGAAGLLLIAAGFGVHRLLPRLEATASDLRARVAPGPVVSPDIVHVDIDDKTVGELGKWPFSRTAHARVLDVLTSLDAGTVAYDVIFHGDGTPQEDVALEQALERNGKVILGAAFQLVREEEIVEIELDRNDLPLSRSALDFRGIDITKLRQGERSFMPSARFAERALGIAHVSAHRDQDGVVRSVPLLIGFNGLQIPSMALSVAMHSTGLEAGRLTPSLLMPDRLTLTDHNNTTTIPVDDSTLMQVRFPGAWGESFPHISFGTLYHAADHPEELKRLVPLIQGKCVIVGLASSGSTDLGSTPMGTAQPQTTVNAAALNTLLTKSFIRSSRMFDLMAVLALCGAVLLVRKTTSHEIFPLVAPALIPLWAGIDCGLYTLFGTAVCIVAPMAAAGAVFISVLGMDYVRAMKEVARRREERRKLEVQLEAASRIQSHFLPPPPDLGPDFVVWAKCVPAAYVGGDFYDVIPLRDGRYLIYLADVSGKGLPASLIMSAAWSRIRSEALLADTPEEILTRANRSLFASLTGEGHFITSLFSVYEPATGKLRYADAGHMPPIICNENGIKEPPKTKSLPLGVIGDAVFSAIDITLEPGDSVIFMSDGVTEAADAENNFFGAERAVETVRELGTNERGPGLMEAVRIWRGTTPPNDDTTVVEIRRTSS